MSRAEDLPEDALVLLQRLCRDGREPTRGDLRWVPTEQVASELGWEAIRIRKAADFLIHAKLVEPGQEDTRGPHRYRGLRATVDGESLVGYGTVASSFLQSRSSVVIGGSIVDSTVQIGDANNSHGPRGAAHELDVVPTSRSTTRESFQSHPDDAFVFSNPNSECVTSRSRAAELLRAAEASERLILVAPNSAPSDGLGVGVDELLDLSLRVDAVAALGPLFGGAQQIRSNGVVWKSDGNVFALATDGSIGIRRRLYHDRRGHGAQVARGDVGLYSSLEQLLQMLSYARRLFEFRPSVRLWSFRQELHGVSGRHLMDDLPDDARSVGTWSKSSPCTYPPSEVVAVGGSVWFPSSETKIEVVLNDAAKKLSTPFGVHSLVEGLRPGRVVLSRSGGWSSTAAT